MHWQTRLALAWQSLMGNVGVFGVLAAVTSVLVQPLRVVPQASVASQVIITSGNACLPAQTAVQVPSEPLLLSHQVRSLLLRYPAAFEFLTSAAT